MTTTPPPSTEEPLRMAEFNAEITDRLRGAAEAVRLAEADGDEVGVHAHRSDLDNLRRLAADHGVPEPDLG